MLMAMVRGGSGSLGPVKISHHKNNIFTNLRMSGCYFCGVVCGVVVGFVGGGGEGILRK